MSQEETIKRHIASHFNVSKDTIIPDTRLVDDLGADSLDSIEIVLAMEAEFDIEIPDDDLDRVETVQDIITIVQDLS